MHKDVIPANHVIIGTCIRCGGPVTAPAEWPETAGGPPRHCQRCGAAQVGYGPRVETTHGPDYAYKPPDPIKTR